MKKDIITEIGGVALASSFYIILFSAVEPQGNWGYSLAFAIGIAVVWTMLKEDVNSGDKD